MSQAIDQLEELLTDSYGLSVKAWLDHWGGQIEKSKAWGEEDEQVEVRHHDGTKTKENYGKYSSGTFVDDQNDRYILVHHDGDFPRNEKLVQAMQDYTLFDVKDYRLVEPLKAAKGYFLYRLVPHTERNRMNSESNPK